MALVLGKEDGVWIDSPREASKQYDLFELAAFRYFARKKPIPSQTGGPCNGEDTSSSMVPSQASSSHQIVLREEGPGLNTTTEGIARNRKRKRKTRSTYTPNTKEVAAKARHEAIRPFILAAYEAFGQRLADGSLPRSWIQPASSEPEMGDEDVDFVALAGVWQADLAEIVFQDSEEHFPLFNALVRNDCASEVLAACMGHTFLLPKRSAFLLSDFSRLSPLIPATRSEGYDIILLDPPWENKSVQRQATYATLPNRNLLGLPLQKLAHSDGALVAIWVTNREKLRAFVESELLATWGLRLEATWHWLKVTPEGETISPLDLAHHRPYEVLVLARAPSEEQDVPSAEREQPSETQHVASAEREQPSEMQQAASDEREQPFGTHKMNTVESPASSQLTVTPSAPDNFVIVSVPGEHSRKPPLKCLLEKYSAKGASSRGLELFARELTAGWTSWGNEVLRFQDAKYFVAKGGRALTPDCSSNHLARPREVK
ncbi:Methyltransferase [Klebsormidium nitens]|uniref:Methyltransferase n=1 Tax=Klebsormidium nitens TaxID=105231 RepID=A0A1Y1IRF0_KLENI|nr:Methyltransferase [Klebsormidium nitens]|eukprot:GAQ91207.1 Methyltransferase [Klebsormidium nitens]